MLLLVLHRAFRPTMPFTKRMSPMPLSCESPPKTISAPSDSASLRAAPRPSQLSTWSVAWVVGGKATVGALLFNTLDIET
jgi:hypothetical protein